MVVLDRAVAGLTVGAALDRSGRVRIPSLSNVEG
jgi:hypothetical protein